MGRLIIFYVADFCRVMLALTFLISSVSKLINVNEFKLTLLSLKIIPNRFISLSANLLILNEFLIILLLFISRQTIIIGFYLAISILLIFTFVLVIAIFTKDDFRCNCFGNSEKTASTTDIFRNVLLIILGITGSFIITSNHENYTLTFFEWGVIVFFASIIMLLWSNLTDMYHFLHQPQ